MKPKWKSHDDPRCTCQGCIPPNLKYASNAALMAWLKSMGWTVPDAVYECGESVNNLSETIGPSYQQTVTCLTRKRS